MSKFLLAKRTPLVVCSLKHRGPNMSEATVPAGMTRYPIQLPLLYWRKEGTRSRAGAGWTCELSEGGATVVLPERLPSQTPLRLRIQTDRGPIEAEARVIWVAEAGPAGIENTHGLVFTQQDAEYLQALQDLLLGFSMVAHAGMRMPVDLPIVCKPKAPGGLPLRGRVGEVSRGGLRLRLPQSLPPGTGIEITLHTGNGPLTLEGAIVWVQHPGQRTTGTLIDHGVRFTSSTWSVSLALGFLLGASP